VIVTPTSDVAGQYRHWCRKEALDLTLRFNNPGTIPALIHCECALIQHLSIRWINIENDDSTLTQQAKENL